MATKKSRVSNPAKEAADGFNQAAGQKFDQGNGSAQGHPTPNPSGERVPQSGNGNPLGNT